MRENKDFVAGTSLRDAGTRVFGKLPLGSRPAKRRPIRRCRPLRAIPRSSPGRKTA
ncbi:hypothetical protein KCP75_21860 [Salmonella enterica subsp. enterica]|nr:hypothetical protein KCP75_21860 [Salmonella enterica subsp. enterica]